MSLIEDDGGGISICSARGVHRYFRGRVEQIMTGVYARDAVAVAPGVLLATAVRSIRNPGEWRTVARRANSGHRAPASP